MVKKPDWKERCTRCGTPLSEPSHVHHNIIEENSNPAPKQVIDFLEFRWECPPEGRFGRNVLVQATLIKYEDRLPYVKVCESLDRTYGLRVTPATVMDITRRVCDWLRPEYERILRRIRAADVVYVDETGAKVDGILHWTGGVHYGEGDPGGGEEERGQQGSGGDTGRGLRWGHRLRWLEGASMLHPSDTTVLGPSPPGGGAPLGGAAGPVWGSLLLGCG